MSDGVQPSTSDSSTREGSEAMPAVTASTASGAAAASRMKRNREAALGPSTPRSEGDETKTLGSGLASGGGASTPLAKKGRVGSDSSNDKPTTADALPRSDDKNRSILTSDNVDEAEDEDRATATGKSRKRTTPPPPAGLNDIEPDTPANSQGVESRDTRQIRRRVQALEWEDENKQQGHNEKAPGSESAADIANEVAESAKVVASQDEQEAQEERQQDVETAKVAEEVAETAAKLGDQDDHEKAQDKKIADVASEVAQSAQTVDVEEQSKSPAPKTTSFSAFSSTSSPFSAVKTSASASPFAAAASNKTEDAQKPKAKASFAASSPFASVAAPSTPSVARVAPSSAAQAPKTNNNQTAAVPSTPFNKFTPAGSTSTPFSTFASKSGFASAVTATSTPKPAGGAASGFGSFSAATASPFASVTAKKSTDSDGEDRVVDTGRKIGEVEEPDPDRKVYTEQEVITGEENDELLHSVRAKLFAMHDGSWVERGTGVLKLNATREGDKNGARLVMRADATHRLLLNAPLFQKFSIEVNQEKYVRFAVIESAEQGPTSYMLRMGSNVNATNLVKAVKDKVAGLS
ncbi:hypothetical protein OIV83_000617 [Microbotryomycetes sp. JL201]|nr:hypothetical protein OIV83_000617 [Microbotryomycetes sp. JL201]